jgi:hypothetical protein
MKLVFSVVITRSAMTTLKPPTSQTLSSSPNRLNPDRAKYDAIPTPDLARILMRARLVSLDGGSSIELVKDLTLVGRDEDCDLRLDHKSISKLHCVIVKTDGLLLIRDLGSTNGTRVNGQRVRRAALLPNDTLAIATLKFQVKFGVELENELTPESSKSKKDEPAAPLQLNALPDVYPEPKTPNN